MAAITWADVLTLPNIPTKVATVDVLFQAVMLDLANTYLDVNLTRGEDSSATKLVRELYVMHLYSMGFAAGTNAATGATGAVTLDQAGKFMRQYGQLNNMGRVGEDPLAQTIYGRMILQLIWPLTRARVL